MDHPTNRMNHFKVSYQGAALSVYSRKIGRAKGSLFNVHHECLSPDNHWSTEATPALVGEIKLAGSQDMVRITMHGESCEKAFLDLLRLLDPDVCIFHAAKPF